MSGAACCLSPSRSARPAKTIPRTICSVSASYLKGLACFIQLIISSLWGHRPELIFFVKDSMKISRSLFVGSVMLLFISRISEWSILGQVLAALCGLAVVLLFSRVPKAMHRVASIAGIAFLANACLFIVVDWTEELGHKGIPNEKGAGYGTPTLLIVIDTLRRDAVDVEGSGDRTPVIRSFSDECIVFHQAISPNHCWRV